MTRLPQSCHLIAEIIENWGGRSYLVGGLVRDWLYRSLENVPADSIGEAQDFDIAVDLRATNRTLLQLLKQLHRRIGATYVYYHRFLTATLHLPEERIDLAHTRDEIYPFPAVLPEVKPAGIERDLKRRDFTINALAIELTKHGMGKVIDPYGGQQDLRQRLVRVIHPESFVDDPTRIFRCLRFGIRFGFEIESGTLYLLRRAVKDGYLALLTPERVLYELRCISKEESALKMLEALFREGVFAGCWRWFPPRGFFTELTRLTQAGIRDELLYLYLLSRLPIDNRFPLTKEERQAQAAIRSFTAIETRLRRARKRSTMYRLLKPVPVPALKVLRVLKGGATRRKLDLFLNELIAVKPDLKPLDLLALGVKPDPQLGKIIERLLCARLDRRVRNRDEELALTRRWLTRNV